MKTPIPDSITNAVEGYGTVFIVDISGFSAFVKKIPTGQGADIISGFLNEIISANILSLNVSEIEGDAILFYKIGRAIDIKVIMAQFELMLKAFNSKKEIVKESCPEVEELSIKLIVNYGSIATYSVGTFSKLYGEVLIETHRLLKNSVMLNTYILIAQSYIKCQKKNCPRKGIELCERYDIGNLCYTYYPYGQA